MSNASIFSFSLNLAEHLTPVLRDMELTIEKRSSIEALKIQQRYRSFDPTASGIEIIMVASVHIDFFFRILFGIIQGYR